MYEPCDAYKFEGWESTGDDVHELIYISNLIILVLVIFLGKILNQII